MGSGYNLCAWCGFAFELSLRLGSAISRCAVDSDVRKFLQMRTQESLFFGLANADEGMFRQNPQLVPASILMGLGVFGCWPHMKHGSASGCYQR
jgi:hypothetical protein